MQLLGKGLKKVYILGLGHMGKVAAMPIYGKTLKNILVHNHLAECLETGYVAFRSSLNFI